MQFEQHEPRSVPGTDPPPRPKLVVVNAHDLLGMDLPLREKLLAPWLESQSLCMVHAWRGIGKTHFALGVAYALASGGEFLDWRALAPVPTLYIDGEMPGPALKDRVARIAASNDAEPAPGYLRFITPDLQPDGVMPNLASYEGQQAIETVLGDARVIVIDNLSCLVRGGKENEAESWQPVADWALRMRATGRSVLFIHHSGKGGQQRGTSKREDLLDVVIALQRPKDYVPDQGARFIVQFEKARSLFGQEVEPFEAALDTDEHGRQVWTLTAADDATDERVLELAELGLPQAEIARELGVARSTVMRKLRKAEEEGRYRTKPAKSSKAKRAAGGASNGHD